MLGEAAHKQRRGINKIVGWGGPILSSGKKKGKILWALCLTDNFFLDI
jgi:hypothetical protein